MRRKDVHDGKMAHADRRNTLGPASIQALALASVIFPQRHGLRS